MYSHLYFITSSAFFCFFVADVDECSLGSHLCNQLCHNTNGNYRCSCREGYKLGADGRTCEGAVSMTFSLLIKTETNVTIQIVHCLINIITCTKQSNMLLHFFFSNKFQHNNWKKTSV